MWWMYVVAAAVVVIGLVEWRSWKRPVGTHGEHQNSDKDHDRHLIGGIDI